MCGGSTRQCLPRQTLVETCMFWFSNSLFLMKCTLLTKPFPSWQQHENKQLETCSDCSWKHCVVCTYIYWVCQSVSAYLSLVLQHIVSPLFVLLGAVDRRGIHPAAQSHHSLRFPLPLAGKSGKEYICFINTRKGKFNS